MELPPLAEIYLLRWCAQLSICGSDQRCVEVRRNRGYLFVGGMNTKSPRISNKLSLNTLLLSLCSRPHPAAECCYYYPVGGNSCSRLFNNLPNWLYLNFTRPLNKIYECRLFFRSRKFQIPYNVHPILPVLLSCGTANMCCSRPTCQLLVD